MQTLFKQIALLGDVWVLWILIALSILGGAVFFERLRAFRDASGRRGASSGIRERVASELQSRAPGPDPVILEQILQALLLQERRTLERRLVVLGTIGSNAPFIGLLGTVLGVIQAFHDLAVTGDGGTGVVMAGIASALVITAVGLFVAIPAVIANNYFRTLIDEELADAEAGARLRVASLLAQRDANEDGPDSELVARVEGGAAR